MRFWIDLYDPGPTGIQRPEGPIITAQSCTVETVMDRAGAISWNMSGLDPRAALATIKRGAVIRGQLIEGLAPVDLGAGVIESRSLAPQKSGDADLSITGLDRGEELAARTVGELEISETITAAPDQAKKFTGLGATYTDLTNALDGNPATTANLELTNSDWLYIGDAAVYNGVNYGAGVSNTFPATLLAEYWNGAAWAELALLDGTAVSGIPFAQSGGLVFETPPNWASTTVDGDIAYWVRLHVTAGTSVPTTVRDFYVQDRQRPTLTGPALIMALAPAPWTLDVVRGYAITAMVTIGSYQSQSVLAALVQLAEHVGEHFWIDSPHRQVIWIRNTWTASGIRAIQSGDGLALLDNPAVCVIESIQIVDNGSEIVNRIYPYGAGNGAARLTLANMSAAAIAGVPAGYILSLAGNYLEHTQSIADYGRHERALSYKDISPITNSPANLENAADVLYGATMATLSGSRAPVQVLNLAVAGLQTPVYPGQTIRVICLGHADILDRVGHVTGRTRMIDIDADLYILSTQAAIDSNGLRIIGLTVADAPGLPRSGVEWQAQEMERGQFMDFHPQLSMCYNSTGDTLRVSSVPAHAETTTFRVGREVLAVNYCLLHFQSGPLISSIKTLAGASTTTAAGGSSEPTTAAGGSSTPTTGTGNHVHPLNIPAGTVVEAVGRNAGGGIVWHGSGATMTPSTEFDTGGHTHTVSIGTHTHTVSIGTHTHTLTPLLTATYGIYEDTDPPNAKPTNISIAINGADVTAALGGPWAADGAAIEIELDITAYLTSAAGGLHQRHRVEFSCAGGQGQIKVWISALLTVQAIAVV